MRAIRPAILPPLLLVMVSVLVGCPKKKGDAGDASAEASAATDAAAAAGPEAANADAVAHFPDEAAIDHQAATLQWATNNARKSPPSGEVVAVLPKGTNVVQISSHDKYVLVTFDNPKNAGERLMGWVVKDAFNAQTFIVPKGPCPSGQTQLLADQIFCGKVCKVDTECPGGQACTGTAQLVLHDAGAGASVKNCTAIVRPAVADAGTPVVVADASAPAVVDAGPAPTAADAGAPKDAGGGGVVADAGGGGGGGGAMVVEPGAGATCPAGYKMGHPDEKCHHTCTPGKDGDCSVFGPGVFCTRGGYCKMR